VGLNARKNRESPAGLARTPRNARRRWPGSAFYKKTGTTEGESRREGHPSKGRLMEKSPQSCTRGLVKRKEASDVLHLYKRVGEKKINAEMVLGDESSLNENTKGSDLQGEGKWRKRKKKKEVMIENNLQRSKPGERGVRTSLEEGTRSGPAE